MISKETKSKLLQAHISEATGYFARQAKIDLVEKIVLYGALIFLLEQYLRQ